MGLKWIPCFGLSIFSPNNLTTPVEVEPILAALDRLDKTNIITINRKTKNATTFSWMRKISHRLVILDNTTILTFPTHLPPSPPRPPPPPQPRSINSHSSPPLRISTSNFPAGGPLIFSWKPPGPFLTGIVLVFSS